MRQVRALNSFHYPESKSVRDAIKHFHTLKKNEGKTYPDELRGVQIQVQVGDLFTPPTQDLLDSWLNAGLVKEVG